MWFKKGGGQDRYISGYSGFVDLNQLGAVVTKGVSCVPWEGNPAPRIMETASGMIYAVGLQNPGADGFIERDLPFLRQFDTKVIVNICGNTVGDYLEMAERFSGQEPGMVEYITREIKKKAVQPVSIKLTPNVTDITEIAKAAADALEFIMAGAAAVVVGTANFRNPCVMTEIIGGLERYMEENGIRDLGEIRGIVS